MKQYDFNKFLNSIGNFNFAEVVIEAEKEVTVVDNALSPGRGRKGLDKQVKYEAGKYRALLGGFLFLLTQGGKPGGVWDEDFQSFRPVIEKLVEKGQLKSNILSLFDDSANNKN
jgi:hypothetical protein